MSKQQSQQTDDPDLTEDGAGAEAPADATTDGESPDVDDPAPAGSDATDGATDGGASGNSADGNADSDETPDDMEGLRTQRDEYLAKWQRAQADYQNLKRRSSTDVENRLRRTMEPLLRNLLLVVDHLDMALMSPTESQDAKNLAMGVELVRRQMMTAMEESQVEPIPDGGSFDPERHQAVARVEDAEAEPGAVLETLRRGYLWRERVLRPAEVRVAGEPESDDGPGDGKSTGDGSSAGESSSAGDAPQPAADGEPKQD